MVIKAFSDPTKFGVKGGGKDKTGKQDTYATILSAYSYSSQTAAKQKRYRQLFIYGMAAHTMGDAFAHSTAIKDSAAKFNRINHTDIPGYKSPADNVDYIPNRYKCAKYGVGETVYNAFYNESHGWIDFAYAAWYGEARNKKHTFYMVNIRKHAEANGMSKTNPDEDIVFVNCAVSPVP